ncbi:hypothetical protein ABK040_001833 [Willaertia magna]
MQANGNNNNNNNSKNDDKEEILLSERDKKLIEKNFNKLLQKGLIQIEDGTPIDLNFLTMDDIIELNSFYKQSTCGDCQLSSKPYWFQFTNKSKWNLWYSLKGMSILEAKKQYLIKLIECLENQMIDEEINNSTNSLSTTTTSLSGSDEEEEAELNDSNLLLNKEWKNWLKETNILIDNNNNNLNNNLNQQIINNLNNDDVISFSLIDQLDVNNLKSSPQHLHIIEQQQQVEKSGEFNNNDLSPPAQIDVIKVSELKEKCLQIEYFVKSEIKQIKQSLENSLKRLKIIESQSSCLSNSNQSLEQLRLEIVNNSTDENLKQIVKNIHESFLMFEKAIGLNSLVTNHHVMKRKKSLMKIIELIFLDENVYQ